MKIKINPIGVEFVFNIDFSSTKRVNFYREFYGYRSYSNYSKYTYIKEGVLSDIKYIKPTKSAVIVSMENSKKVRDFFKKYHTHFNERIVILSEEDSKELGLSYPRDWNRIYEEIKENPNTFFSASF